MKKNKTNNLVPVQELKTFNLKKKLKLDFLNYGTGTQRTAFTLVELIVVITILAILWTIAFISLQWYSKDARDSVRISDLSNIDIQLELYLIKWSKLPIPEDAIILTSSWVIIWYQWYIWEEILNKIWVHGWWKDPLDDSLYTYRINWTKSQYQVMWFLEDWTEISLNLLSQTNAADLTKRYPTTKGKILWILLEQTTNKPLQQIVSNTVELRTYNATQIDMYLSTTTKQSWTWTTTMFWTMENLARSQKFTEPEECPKWFIPVPWNRDLWQTWFCVAKYEMSYSDADVPNSTWGWIDFNTVSYTWSKIPVSMSWKYPIADIKQQQAIDSCKSIWVWYHLITNNEWITIARNIEKQPINWSWWVVWINYIFNWVSNHNMWCWTTPSWTIDIYTELPRKWATMTWWWFWNIDCDDKRKLTLSNGEVIWDLSWNIWENVNKANTLDWNWFDLWFNPNILDKNDDRWEWSDTSVSKENKNMYGPSIWIDSNNGIWKIYQWNWTVYLRWGNAYSYSSTGEFALFLAGTNEGWNRLIWFRCAK